MDRLYDRLLAYGFHRGSRRASVQDLIVRYGEPAVIRIDSVEEYLSLAVDEVDIRGELGCIVPPYEHLFIESAFFIKPRHTKDSYPHKFNRHGAFVNSEQTDGGWSVVVERVADVDSVLLSSRVLLTVDLDAAGEFLDAKAVSLVPGESPDTEQELRECLSLLYALSLLHYKDHALVEDEVPKRVRKKAVRKNKPLVRSHTLEIKAMKEYVRRVREAEKTGIKVGVHTVRGHKVTYTEAAPLFGKYVGTYFKAPHIRGSNSEGLVLKDYEVTL